MNGQRIKSWKKGVLPLMLAAGLLCGPGVVVHAVAQSAPVTSSQGDAAGRSSTPEAQSPEKNQSEVNEDEAYRHSAVVKFLGGKLGMSTDAAATLFEFVNFLVLAGLIGVFLLKTLPKTFRDRTSQIQKRLVDARAATAEASARLNSVEDRLKKLDGEIAAMRAQAEKDLAGEEIRVRAAIDEERAKIVSSSEQEIAAIAAQARRDIQQYAAELAVSQAAKQLVVTAETDRLLVQQFAGRLTGKNGEQN